MPGRRPGLRDGDPDAGLVRRVAASLGLLRIVVGHARARGRAMRQILLRPSVAWSLGVKVPLDPAWSGGGIRDRLYREEYEEQEARLLRASLSRDDRYLELGAGIGLMATVASQIVGDERVLAVEANPDLLDVFARTTALNGFRPRLLWAVVVGDEASAEAAFHVRDEYWLSSSRVHPDARTVTVPARSLARLVEEHRASYLNVDIEGAETDLLRADLPSSVRSLCVEVHPVVTGDAAIGRMLVGLIAQGFALDTELSGANMLFLRR